MCTIWNVLANIITSGYWHILCTFLEVVLKYLYFAARVKFCSLIFSCCLLLTSNFCCRCRVVIRICGCEWMSSSYKDLLVPYLVGNIVECWGYEPQIPKGRTKTSKTSSQQPPDGFSQPASGPPSGLGQPASTPRPVRTGGPRPSNRQLWTVLSVRCLAGNVMMS